MSYEFYAHTHACTRTHSTPSPPHHHHHVSNFRRGYYAAVSYTDYNIGQLLIRLDTLELTASTVVIVFGDHGWQVRARNSLLPLLNTH